MTTEWHDPFGLDPRVRPVTETEVAVNEKVPPQNGPEARSVLTRPAGSVSVSVTPVRAVPVFGLLRSILRNVVPFSGIVGGANDLVNVGGCTGVGVAFPGPADTTNPVAATHSTTRTLRNSLIDAPSQLDRLPKGKPKVARMSRTLGDSERAEGDRGYSGAGEPHNRNT
jgi:hypothetical protein